MTSKLQLLGWLLLVAAWTASCNWFGSQPTPAPTPAGTLVPCATVTTTAITDTKALTSSAPLTDPMPISPTLTITITSAPTPTAIITLTVTPPPTLTVTGTITATLQPTATARTPLTTTLTPTPVLTATKTVTATVQPAPTVRGTVTTTVTPIATLAPTRTMTATTPATRVTPLPATNTPMPRQSPTATQAPPATATRANTPAPTNTPLPSPTPTPTRPPTATITPTRAATPTGGPPPPTPTPAPANTVFVRSHRSFTSGSTYVVVGEVLNSIAAPVFRVRVIGTFYNASDQVAATQEVYAFLVQTSPDQRNPFKFQVENPAGDITRYDLTVAWEEISVVTYQDIAVLSQEVRQNNGSEVAGQVQNDFEETLGSLIVVVTLYDAAGGVVDVYQSTPQATQLAPGDTTEYAVPIAPDQPFTSFSVQVQGKRAIFF